MKVPTKGAVTVRIGVPAEQLYAMVSDVTRMGEWSPQTYHCEWVQGATGPVVGARFKARNRRGRLRWANTPEVIAADPGREFAFKRRAAGSEVVWRWSFQPADGSTTVTESYEVTKPSPRPVVWLFTRMVGIDDADADLQANIRQTLDRLSTAASR